MYDRSAALDHCDAGGSLRTDPRPSNNNNELRKGGAGEGNAEEGGSSGVVEGKRQKGSVASQGFPPINIEAAGGIGE